MQAAHAVNALAFERRYEESAEVWDISNPDIIADLDCHLAKGGGIRALLYNLDDQAPAWLEDRLYELRDDEQEARRQVSANYEDNYQIWMLAAIEANQPNVARWFARLAAAVALNSHPSMRMSRLAA